MQKALLSGADALILDLEDSVSLVGKADARSHVADLLTLGTPGKALFVRINALDSGFVEDDLRAVVHLNPAALVLPKAEGSGSIVELDRLLKGSISRRCRSFCPSRQKRRRL